MANEEQEVMSLIRDLIHQTEAGEITWGQADEAGEAFYIKTGAGLLRVASIGEKDHPFLFQIFDAEDRKIYERTTEVARFYSEPEALLAELFYAARGSVFDVKGAVRRIRDSLDL